MAALLRLGLGGVDKPRKNLTRPLASPVVAFRLNLDYNFGMYYNDDEDNEDIAEAAFGSDELLASDELRLPASANVLVRLHALRAWLNRRRAEAESEIGTAALALQQAMSEPAMETRPRRRFAQDAASPVQHAQHMLQEAQQASSAYEEAHTLLEDCVAHLTAGERVLVEYYLALEELVQAANAPTDAPWLIALSAVRHRVEQVGTPGEEDV